MVYCFIAAIEDGGGDRKIGLRLQGCRLWEIQMLIAHSSLRCTASSARPIQCFRRDGAVSTSDAIGRYVGRVGALAVALGVGSAVAAMPIAFADTTGSQGSTGTGTSDAASSTKLGAPTRRPVQEPRSNSSATTHRSDAAALPPSSLRPRNSSVLAQPAMSAIRTGNGSASAPNLPIGLVPEQDPISGSLGSPGHGSPDQSVAQVLAPSRTAEPSPRAATSTSFAIIGSALLSWL